MPPPGFEPFLHAICGAPDDDVPRLVYADWLDEHGDPNRAEFIRVQCETARAKANGWPDRRLEHTERALWAKYSDVWRRAEMGRLPGLNWTAFGYRRGFPYRAEYNPGAFRSVNCTPKPIERLFTVAPIRSLIVSGAASLGGLVAEVGRVPATVGLRELLLCPSFGSWGGGLTEVMTAPYLSGLQRIVVRVRGFVMLSEDEEGAVCEAARRWTSWTLQVRGRQVAALQADRLRAVMGDRFTHGPI